ncbi:hypothetical protein HanXRQr2_Chr09g0377591 [Helianthus annuus]|uniref:Uncharacterized protein n=1 Tax=Helianthus annuus TaxID=4232 RepID=A0A9K3I594_HELAN|nr:hypothetical protein HanXRQr2_Chr09g0377591 [Helianthus annuus]KAJ0533311.1 hypothetical protein HanIR_Chr09g0406961 [Helianthus annuus]KAJ0706703.1 hypothetical protein HanLR1_Chr09g0310091 [Helianthus annuus]
MLSECLCLQFLCCFEVNLVLETDFCMVVISVVEVDDDYVDDGDFCC